MYNVVFRQQFRIELNLKLFVFDKRRKPKYPRKTSRARVETKNKFKQNMPWRRFRGVRVQATLVRGECSHRFATLADPLNYFLFASPLLVCL